VRVCRGGVLSGVHPGGGWGALSKHMGTLGAWLTQPHAPLQPASSLPTDTQAWRARCLPRHLCHAVWRGRPPHPRPNGCCVRVLRRDGRLAAAHLHAQLHAVCGGGVHCVWAGARGGDTPGRGRASRCQWCQLSAIFCRRAHAKLARQLCSDPRAAARCVCVFVCCCCV
jgi:hypothetical protein